MIGSYISHKCSKLIGILTAVDKCPTGKKRTRQANTDKIQMTFEAFKSHNFVLFGSDPISIVTSVFPRRLNCIFIKQKH